MLRLLWYAKIRNIFTPESKWRFNTIFIGNVTGNTLAFKQCQVVAKVVALQKLSRLPSSEYNSRVDTLLDKMTVVQYTYTRYDRAGKGPKASKEAAQDAPKVCTIQYLLQYTHTHQLSRFYHIIQWNLPPQRLLRVYSRKSITYMPIWWYPITKYLKGTVQRDFRPPVLFHNSNLPGPQSKGLN